MRARSTFAAIVMAAAIAVTASGCIGQPPAPSPSPTASSTPTSGATRTPPPTPSSTPTPTPTPTPEAAYDPADMSTWLISYTGIGPVQLDRPVDDVLAEVAAGEATCRPGIASFFDHEVVAVGDGSDPHLVAVALTGPANVDAATAPHTDAGITAGSTFEQLLTAYPDAESFTDSTGRPGYRLTDGTSWIHFTSNDGEIINYIDVSRTAGNLKEYCG